jgi:type I restriction enzyme S subunit
MSAQALLKRFDIVADHSGNIPAIRRLVVDLAVRGKLLRTDELDMDVQEMLERISSTVSKLTLAGLIKKQKPLEKIGNDEVPAAYLAHCTFARLGNIANLQKGLTGIQSSMSGEYPLVVTAAERGTCDHFDFDGAAAIIPLVSSTGHGNASINRLHYQDGKFALGTILCAVIPFDEQLISARFLYEYLTAFKEELLVSKMIGTANVTLTLGKLAEVPVPIIAPAVQRRVDELMALCDQLEAAQQERERRRDRLAAASLQRLNQPATYTTPDAQREHARFHLQILPRLTTRPEHIKAMRQTILNLAVGGKLMDQAVDAEPASVLLKRLQADIKSYGVQNRVQPVTVSAIPDGAEPYPLPVGWIWTRLASLCRVVTDGDHLPPPKSDDGVAFLTIGNVSGGTLNFANSRYVPQEYFDKITPYRRPEVGDLLYTVVGASYGRPVQVEGDQPFCVQRHIAILKPAAELQRKYLHLLLRSPFVYDQATASLTGTAQPTIPLRPLRNFLVPLPPLAEQHRIVAKVDELMALCDQLEAQLTTTQTDCRRLLESVLDAALASL